MAAPPQPAQRMALKMRLATHTMYSSLGDLCGPTHWGASEKCSAADHHPPHTYRYEYRSEGVDGVGYYRLPSAPPPADPRAQSLLVLREAADAGAEFVRCAEFVGAVVGYDFREGPEVRPLIPLVAPRRLSHGQRRNAS